MGSSDRSLRGADGVSFLVQVLALLLVALVAFAAYQAFFGVDLGGAASLRVTHGDRVRVDYIGTYEDGLVFDTSFESVARDNATYPKAATFRWRATWESFAFQVGSGQAIAGFDEGVLGLTAGASRTLVIPPEKAYGQSDPALVETHPLVEAHPVLVTLERGAFLNRFGQEAVEGAVYVEPPWGWNVTVLAVAEATTYRRDPVVGQAVTPMPWPSVVAAVDDEADDGLGAIEVRHLLTAEDVGRSFQVSADRSGRLVAVDPAAGTFVLDFNPPNAGRTLIFQITVVEITRE